VPFLLNIDFKNASCADFLVAMIVAWIVVLVPLGNVLQIVFYYKLFLPLILIV
jgi:hypothetical protein